MFWRRKASADSGAAASPTAPQSESDDKDIAGTKILPDVADLANADTVDTRVKENLERFEHLFGTDEDAYEQPTTSRKELWAYYLYYNGDNGVGPLSYSQALYKQVLPVVASSLISNRFQSALVEAGTQPGTNKACTPSSDCVIPWPGGSQPVNSVVLIANGICFALMTLLFVWMGSAADYGSFGRYLLLTVTVICWIFQYCFMAVKGASQWKLSMGIYIISYVSYGATLVFYSAVFPRLARYMPHVRKAREEDLKDGKISQTEYDQIESLEKNHISNISTAHSNIGYLLTLLINLGILIPLASDTYANNWALFLTNTYWVVLGIWWFIFQQRRPGPKMPKGSNYLTIGWKQVALALREVRHLPQTFLYLVAFFLLADGLNTTGTLISIIQNDVVSFSFLQLTYLGITQAVCSITSTFGFWYFQKYFNIRTKPMFIFTNVFTILIPLWGMIGLWTTRIGYHNYWEFFLYNAVFGIAQAPYYAYSQTLMAEFTPRGYENMFFGLFGITNRASSLIGPNCVAAISNATGNQWMGFPFLFAICTAASIMIWCIDVEKGRENCRKFVEERKVARAAREAGLTQAEVLQKAVDGSLDTAAAATATGAEFGAPLKA